MAWCTDVLTDKLHSWFDKKILSKKVRLIHQSLGYVSYNRCMFNTINDIILRQDYYKLYSNQIVQNAHVHI